MAAACSTPSIDGFGTTEISVGDEELTVLFAETSSQRQQGLRDVEALPGDIDGMLFSFGVSRSATFGMLDTLIPLDIWWFDEDGHLVGSAEMEPCPEEPCTDYGSPGPVMWALETPLGEYDFEAGDGIRFIQDG